MELLLTGSTGFVGRNLLLHLIPKMRWHRIILPVRAPEKLRTQLAEEGIDLTEHKERLQIVKVSDDAWELPSDIMPELVIHAAGKIFGREQEEYFQTNVTGSLNLASQLPESARMIVLSSLAAGGPTPKREIARTLNHPDLPISYYGESKLAMEKVLRAKLKNRLLILRPPMVLGPRDTATLPLFTMARGRVRLKPGFREKHYSWIAVSDLCEALLTMAHSPWPINQHHHGPFYLTASATITDRELLDTAAEVIKVRGIMIPLPHAVIQLASMILDANPAWRSAVPSLGQDRVREILPDRWVCDESEFTKNFDWKATANLSETLRLTAHWLFKS